MARLKPIPYIRLVFREARHFDLNRVAPEPRKHNIHRFGFYSSKARAYRAKTNLALSTFTNEGSSPKQIDSTISPQKRAALRKRWAHLIRRVYLTDPLICPDCGGELRVIAFITEPKVIRKILRHLQNRRTRPALLLLHSLNLLSRSPRSADDTTGVV